METFEAYDVVVVPFPFTDRQASRRRPALVLSKRKFQAEIGHAVLAMITSSDNSAWPLDVEVTDLDRAGLTSSSKVRMKIFTLDGSLILRKLGVLAKPDQKKVQQALDSLF